ncbi:MAG: YceD family protein [Pseudomonadota bacterium]
MADDLEALPQAELLEELHSCPVSGWIELHPSGAHGGRPRLSGRVEAIVPATCQRSLEPFRLTLHAELDYELVEASEAGKTLSAGEGAVEYWELDEPLVRPIDIVDEALLMAMPLVARNEDPSDRVSTEAEADGEEMTHPFASLRAQMDEANKD